MRITPAYRIHWVGGDYVNRLDSSTAPVNDYGSIDQPKLSVAIMPAEGVTLYGNWGKTFQIGVGSSAYLISATQDDLSPSINEGWELGAKVQLGGLLETRLAWWQQSASNEFTRILNSPSGDSENLGATRRKGVDAQLNVHPVAGLSVWGALSWQQAVIRTPPASAPGTAGNEVDHTPHWLWSGGIDWLPIEPLTITGKYMQ